MPMEELEITIDPEGNVSVRVKGVKGERCEDVTRDLEEAIGDLEERKHTDEYYQRDTGKETERINERL